HRPVAEDDVDLDRWVAPRIEDLASVDQDDRRVHAGHQLFAFVAVARAVPAAAASGSRSRRTAIPGSSRPSRNSSDAPPPVLMCVNLEARPCCSIAATESPPPTTTVAPASAFAARKRAIAFVPWANDGISKTPSGPFQK